MKQKKERYYAFLRLLSELDKGQSFSASELKRLLNNKGGSDRSIQRYLKYAVKEGYLTYEDGFPRLYSLTSTVISQNLYKKFQKEYDSIYAQMQQLKLKIENSPEVLELKRLEHKISYLSKVKTEKEILEYFDE